MGSKLMAAMGYREGQGLGPANSGAVAPVEVRLPARRQSPDSDIMNTEVELLTIRWIFFKK